MSARTLSGALPGLLQQFSPTLLRATSRIHGEQLHSCVVVNIEVDQAYVAGPNISSGWVLLDHLELDLSIRTGRWHAALWVVAETARLAVHAVHALNAAELELVERIAWGEDCDDEDIEELRGLALRLVPS